MHVTRAKRQSWVDFARGIAIILVVYRHVFIGIKNSGIDTAHYVSLEYFNIIFFSFRMPLFFIVSGIFVSASLKKRGFQRYVEAKARTILYPYLLWGTLQITIQLLFHQYVNSERTSYDYLYLFYQPRRIEQFWYLLALFNVSVLYVILKYILKIRVLYLLLIGISMYYLSAFCHRHDFEIGFLFDVFSYYIYIVIGDLLHSFMTREDNIKKIQSWVVVPILLLPFLATQIYFLVVNLKHLNISEYRYVEYYQPTLFFIIAMTGCAFILSVCFLLQKIKRPGWLRIVGKNSLYIYVAHVICFATSRAILINVLNVTNTPVLLSVGIVVGLFVPILMYNTAVRLRIDWIFSLKERPIPKPEENIVSINRYRE